MPFKTVAGVEMQHVPYRGSAPALNDIIAGRVDVMFDYPVSVGPHVEAGKLKVLATTAPERLGAFPDVATMAELGMKDMTTQSWSSIMVPAGTPAPVVDRLAAAAHAALTSERVRTHFEKVGTRPMTLQKAEMIVPSRKRSCAGAMLLSGRGWRSRSFRAVRLGLSSAWASSSLCPGFDLAIRVFLAQVNRRRGCPGQARA